MMTTPCPTINSAVLEDVRLMKADLQLTYFKISSYKIVLNLAYSIDVMPFGFHLLPRMLRNLKDQWVHSNKVVNCGIVGSRQSRSLKRSEKKSDRL